MKQLSLVTIASFLLFFSSCKKEATIATEANVYIHFNNNIGGKPVQLGQNVYNTNTNGQKMALSLLKYYIHNASIVNTATGEAQTTLIDTFRLIDEGDANRLQLQIGKIKNANFNKLRFNVGVPKNRNHSGAQVGDLDPTLGMIWTWNTGYVFMKMEGKFIDSNGAVSQLSNHFATDGAYANNIEVPITLDLKGKDAHVYINFDIGKLYNQIDLNTSAFVHSDEVKDAWWIDKFRTNLYSAFTFSNVSYAK